MLDWIEENPVKSFVVAALILGTLVLAPLCFRIVPVGSVGVRTFCGKVTGDVAEEGIRMTFPPFIAGIKKMDAKIQKVDLELEGSTKDLQTVRMMIVLNIRLDKSKAPEVYRNFNQEYVERIVKPNMAEVYKAVGAKYNAEELITKRDQVSTEIVEEAKEILTGYGIIVERVSIAQFDFSETFDEAVEAKVTAEQAAQKAKNELERVRFEAQQAEEKAKGEANAILEKARAEAEAAKLVSESLTPAYVIYEAARKWDGKAPTHIIGGDVAPMLDISSKLQDKE